MPDKRLRRVSLPSETVESVENGATCYTGVAMAIKIAGEDVIVMARDISQLDKVFNYCEAHLCAGRADLMDTLRTSACPPVVIMSAHSVHLDDEL